MLRCDDHVTVSARFNIIVAYKLIYINIEELNHQQEGKGAAACLHYIVGVVTLRR